MSQEQILRDTLESARNGIKWWMDRYPGAVTDADHDMLKDIDAVLGTGANETILVDEVTFDVPRKAAYFNAPLGSIFSIQLTNKEFDLALYLAKRKGQVCPFKDILKAVWGPAHAGNITYLRVYVSQVRNLLPNIDIRTHSRIGYEWVGRKTL